MKKIKRKKGISKKLKKFLIKNNLESIYKDLKYSKNGNNYFDFSNTDKSKISYLKGDRIPNLSHLIYNHDYRISKGYHAKIGKLLSDKIPNSDIQRISALLFELKEKQNTKFILTSDICIYYLEDNYSKDYNSGSLYSSCMRHDDSQDAIKLYEKLGNNIVQLLVLLDNNGAVLGRALYWHKVKCGDDYISYMDRVYAVNDNIESMFYNYADSKKILHYKSLKSKSLYIKVCINYDDVMPYFDTFQYYDGSALNTYGGEYELISTNYEILENLSNNSNTCHSCGERFNADECGGYSNNDDCYYCEECGVYVNDDIRSIDDCAEINNEWYLKDDIDICYSDYNNKYYLRNDVYYSEYESDYFEDSQVIFIESIDDYHLCDNCVEINNEWYLKEDCVEINNEWYLKEDCIEINNEWYLKEDCIEINNEWCLKEDCVEINNEWYCQNSPKLYFDDDLQKYKLRQYSFIN